jgi:hypothetical protein
MNDLANKLREWCERYEKDYEDLCSNVRRLQSFPARWFEFCTMDRDLLCAIDRRQMWTGSSWRTILIQSPVDKILRIDPAFELPAEHTIFRPDPEPTTWPKTLVRCDRCHGYFPESQVFVSEGKDFCKACLANEDGDA